MVPATFYVVVGGNDVYWRVENPAKQVDARVCKLPAEQADKLLRAPHDFDPFPWSATERGEFSYPAHVGIAVWTRPCLVRARHALAMNDQGIVTVAEVDDNHLSEAHLNLFMRQNEYGTADRLAHLRAFSLHDRIVFSTEWLRDRYRAALKQLGAIPELFVCHNNADLDDQPERDVGDGRLRVGWMGSPQHARDLRLAFPAFEAAREDGCDVVVMGHDIRDETGVTHPRALDSCRAWASVITRHIPWVDPAEYHRRALPFDIGIAPLEYNDHTLGKSDVKAIEYVMSGAVPLLQNHPVYAKHWHHNETCLLAGSPAEFTHCLRELVRSRGLRERLLGAATEYVRAERSNERTRREWGEALA